MASANELVPEKRMENLAPRAKQTISIGRLPGMTWRSKNTLGNDAMHAVMYMPGAFSVELQSESVDVAAVSYEWHMPLRSAKTAEFLAERGILLID